SFNRYGQAPSMELFLYPSNAKNIKNIFDAVELTTNELNIRLIGESSQKTNKELLDFYNSKFPYWKGDLRKEPHLIKPLFIKALKSTSLYQDLQKQLNHHGYTIENISFEKLEFMSN